MTFIRPYGSGFRHFSNQLQRDEMFGMVTKR